MTTAAHTHLPVLESIHSELRLIRKLMERDHDRRAAPDPVLTALADTFGHNNFTSRDAIDAAHEAKKRAETLGERIPDLPHELESADLSTAHAIGRYLGALSGQGVVNIGRDRSGTLWTLDPSVYSSADESITSVSRMIRAL